ncbi:MAG TPA: hypothetical protein VFZ09_51185 [Archangium sp.]|uniref:hypothetical protein n=1 Tax=Archangium sp. TaxID=1872627 RepID=UPI002E316D10|nr:hypothetical protein [Archangium sp.]HEX5754652.1 hypothetical protein [Archangium sp.]
MPLEISCHPRGRSLLALSGLALLLGLLGCTGHAGLLGARDCPAMAGAGQEAVEVDFEVVTPRQAGDLRQRGVQLPRVSRLGDPREHRDFVEHRVTAVGLGLTTGGYLLYCEGLPLPVLVPESLVDLELTSAEPLSDAIYPDRNEALGDMAASASGSGRARYAWYRGAGGALIVPTVFSPATTPRIARTMLAVRQQLGETVQQELKALLLDMAGNRVLRGVFSRVVRMGSEPALRPSVRKEGPGGEAPAPRQPVTRAAAPAAPPAPAPAPGAPAPSPGLVQALTGTHPTPPVAAGPRLPQDAAVNPKVPRFRETDRPIGSSPSQNAQLQADIEYLRSIGAENIRVNQQQVAARNSQRVGTNRPDLQFDYEGRRYQVEYDTPTSGRGPGHQSRITSNDPDAKIILLIVP